MTIKNLTIKKGKVLLRPKPSEVLTVESVSEIASLSPEQKVAIKKLIVTGTNSSDLDGIKTIGEDNGELPNLESIELKNMDEVPEQLFFISSNNTWLESFSAPEATNIGYNAFEYCFSLTEINLPEATNIGYNAFVYCFSLAEINLSEATNIGNRAFQYCYSLTEINLPEATNIGMYAFTDCNVLRKLTLGGTNITVHVEAFVSKNTEELDLYLRATEMQSSSVTGNKWTKGNKTWTFKSINQIP